MLLRTRSLLSFGVIIGALLTATPAGATQPLEEFLARASKTSFDARDADVAKRQREAEADASLGRLLPSLSARGVYTRNQYEAAAQLGPTKLVITPQDQLDAFFQLDVPIVDLASYYRYRAARAAERVAGETEKTTQVEISRAVTRGYYQFVGASALLRAARESEKLAGANLKNVEDRRSAGAATELDRERARANVERARQDVADAELAIALAGRALETLSGMAPTDAGDFPEDDLHAEAPLDRWLALGGETPQERTAKEAARAANESKKAAYAAYAPILSGTALERLTNATGFAGKESIYTLTLNLSWRIDYATIATPRAQQAGLDAAKVREERAQRGVADAIFEAHRRVEAGIVKGRSARAQAQAATRAAELAVDRFNAGASTQLDVTQAQRDAFLADAARIQADADLAFARAQLRIAAGRGPSDRRNP